MATSVSQAGKRDPVLFEGQKLLENIMVNAL
jgi:hypothetical protein